MFGESVKYIATLSNLSQVSQFFYRATAYNAMHGIAVAILSVRYMYCEKTKQRTANILIPHETAITSFLTPAVVGVRRPIPSEICAQSDSPLRKMLTSADFPL